MLPLVYLAIALLPGVLSQATTTAVCTVASLSWTFNSLRDSPCQVAADLAGVCNGGVFDLKPLDDGFVYLGPTVAVQNTCRCSSVYYSMLSACAACQNRDWLDWGEYDANCTTVYPGVFLQPIPAGTRVPAWAYADVTVTGSFNLTVAERLDAGPESTGAASSTNPFPTSRTTTGLGTTSRTAFTTSPTSGQSGSSSGSNAGAIAGGVIGGVVGLALIGGIAFFFLRRRRQGSEQPPSSAFSTTPYMAAPHNPDQNMSYNPSANPFTPVTPAQQNLYDPSDPSTFPSTPAPVSPYTSTYSPPPHAQTFSSFHDSATQVGQHPPQMQMPGPAPTGHYTGAPEI